MNDHYFKGCKVQQKACDAARIGTYTGAGVGTAGVVGAVAVAGVSTAGLATIGGVIGGGVITGAVTLVAAPIVAAAAVGGATYWLLLLFSSDKETTEKLNGSNNSN